MSKAVYIIGTSHEYQFNAETCQPEDIEEFKDYLKFIYCKNGIAAIAEEMSLEALEHQNRSRSVPAKLAAEKELSHKYCDPDSEQLKKEGIKHSGYYVQGIKFPEPLKSDELKGLSPEEAERLEWEEDLKREPCWKKQIVEFNNWPLLFICGSKHVESFAQKLSDEDFIVKIVQQNWAPSSQTIPG